MLQFFRTLLKSRFGAGVGLAFLLLIALAFASGDVVGTGSFGGGASGSQVATVGKKPVEASELSQAATAALERMKQEQPTMSMKAFLANGGLDKVFDDLTGRIAVAEFGRRHGIVAGERLIDSEITQMAAFKGPDGNFSQELFRQAVRQRGLSEKLVRDDIAQGLIARQLLLPAGFGSVAPRELAKRYAALLTEKRVGAVALFPSAAFAPAGKPSDAAVAAYYAANRDRFIRPERRTIRYASFGAEALKDVAVPTEAEIAASYAKNKAQYAASENRVATQLIVPTEAAARAVIAEVGQGKTLEAVARAKGLATTQTRPMDKATLAREASPAVADAVFAAARGALAAPARGALGWQVMRVDTIDTRPARSFDQVRGEIAQVLATDKKRAALNAMISRIEDEFDQGGNLSDTAKELGVTIAQTGPLTADGTLYLKAEKAPAVLAGVVPTAFAMEQENQPQIAEVEPGKTFLIYDVVDIQPSAPAPLKEILPDVTTALIASQAAASAKAAAQKVQAEVRKGSDFGKAVAGLNKGLPPVQMVAMGREQLVRMQQQGQGQIPPPLALLFSMAEGTIKLLAAPDNQGWFVVQLRDIEPGKVTDSDPLLAEAEAELGKVIGAEYTETLGRAIRADIGVTRSKPGIAAVAKQLSGGN